MLTDLTWDKTVNKYAPGRPPWTSSHSADTFSVGLVLSSILRRWEALVPSASSLPCRCVSTGSPGDVGWWTSLLSDQVAPAHHNHSQSYRPSYSDTTFSSGCFSGSHLNVRKGVRSPVSGRSPAPRGPPGTNLGGLRGRSRALRNVPETLPGRSQLRPSHPGRLGRAFGRLLFLPGFGSPAQVPWGSCVQQAPLDRFRVLPFFDLKVGKMERRDLVKGS